MGDAPVHKFRDSDISLREYTDAQIRASVDARQADTHDLAALVDQKLGGLKDLLLAELAANTKVMDERDKLYTERAVTNKTQVDAALKSAETLTNAAFAASEKAIVKSDVNSEKWRENANEWRAAMMDRESKFAPRAEMETEFKSLRAEVQGLRESRSEGVGGKQQATDLRAWIVAGIAIIGFLFMLQSHFTSAPAPVYTPAPSGTQLPTTPPARVP